jgi:hypothetical protein
LANLSNQFAASADRRFEFNKRRQLFIRIAQRTASRRRNVRQHCSLNRWIQIALSNSTKAVSTSSACTTNRRPSSRCASAIQTVRPLESIAKRIAPTPTGFAELSAIISHYFTHALCLGYSKCYQGWLCWRRISSPNHDAQTGRLLYAVDRFSVERSQS